MSKQRRCIRITGTRTGKLRAKVEIEDPDGLGDRRFEVTIGGEKWKTTVSKDLQRLIVARAQKYVTHLQNSLWSAASGIDPIPF